MKALLTLNGWCIYQEKDGVNYPIKKNGIAVRYPTKEKAEQQIQKMK